jgi:hypothetical protein
VTKIFFCWKSTGKWYAENDVTYAENKLRCISNVAVWKSTVKWNVLLNMNCLTNLLPGWNILINFTNCWSSTSERRRLITLCDRWYISIFFIWYYVVKHFSYSHCSCCLCHINRIHTCNTINILIAHQLFNDDFINDEKCFTT